MNDTDLKITDEDIGITFVIEDGELKKVDLDLTGYDKKIRADAIGEFVRWAYIHGIDFSFMGKFKDDGTSDIPERLQKIKNDFWEQLKEQENE